MESALHEGISLFNAGHFWHAHEAWEQLWLTQQGQQRQTTQGLIQAAAALVHWQRGNRRGLLRNWEKARLKLLASAPAAYGLDLAALIGAMDALCAEKATAAPQITHLTSADPMLY